jgi:hypothetical protein
VPASAKIQVQTPAPPKKKKKKKEEEERKRKKDVSFHQTFFLFALTQSQACIKV